MGQLSEGVSLGHGIAMAQTDKAVLIDIEDHGETWIPQSQIHDDSEVWKSGQDGEVVVTLWFAEKRGWS